MSSILLWKPSVMPLLRVKRHMATDFLRPGGKSLAELNQLSQAGVAQLMEGAEEARDQSLTLFAGAMFLQQQITEPLLEPVNEFQSGVLS